MTTEKITGKLELNEVGEVAQSPHELAQTDEVRRGKKNEWLLIGRDPKSGVPIWKFDWEMFHLNDKYPPQKLRALRKERGVGGGQAKRRRDKLAFEVQKAKGTHETVALAYDVI